MADNLSKKITVANNLNEIMVALFSVKKLISKGNII